MTRKVYILIAAAINRVVDDRTNDPETTLICCLNIADALATDNPRFDRERFLKACGVT